MPSRRRRASRGGGADFEIAGGEQLAQLAKALKAVGDKELVRALYRAINRATKEARAAVRQAASDNLPRRGGLAKRVARSKIVTKRRLAGREASVSIVASSSYDIRGMNRGEVRHPLYGDREWWYDQPIPKAKGWWSDTLADQAPNVREQLETEQAELVKQIETSAGG
jgi:hypothetical protein